MELPQTCRSSPSKCGPAFVFHTPASLTIRGNPVIRSPPASLPRQDPLALASLKLLLVSPNSTRENRRLFLKPASYFLAVHSLLAQRRSAVERRGLTGWPPHAPLPEADVDTPARDSVVRPTCSLQHPRVTQPHSGLGMETPGPPLSAFAPFAVSSPVTSSEAPHFWI